MAAFTRTSFCFIPHVSLEMACCLLHTLVAAGPAAEATLRLSLTSSEIFGVSRQTTYMDLKRSHPHWSVCPLRSSVWEEGE